MPLYEVKGRELLIYSLLLLAALWASSPRQQQQASVMKATPGAPAAAAAAAAAAPAASSPPPSPACLTPFGTLLGWADGVPAYSNCVDTHFSDELVLTKQGQGDAFRFVPEASTAEDAATMQRQAAADRYAFTGVSWQCVEYARRYLWVTRNVTFGSVDGAEDIFALTTVSNPLAARTPAAGGDDAAASGGLLPMERFSNGHPRKMPAAAAADATGQPTAVERLASAAVLPRSGDVVIWSRQPDMPYGHVGIVVAVNAKPNAANAVQTDGKGVLAAQQGEGATLTADVLVADQNYHFVSWGGANHSMVLALAAQLTPAAEGGAQQPRATATATVTDPNGYAVLGWMRVAQP